MDLQEQLKAEHATINAMWKILRKWIEKIPINGDEWGMLADDISKFANSRGEGNEYMYDLGNAIIKEIESLNRKAVER